MRIEEENFLNVIFDKPTDGVVDGSEVSQLDKGLNKLKFTLVLSKSL